MLLHPQSEMLSVAPGRNFLLRTPSVRDQASDVSLKHKVWGYWKKVEQACLERGRATEQSQPQLETCWRLEGKRSNILAFPLLLFSNLLPVPPMPKPSQKPANMRAQGL